jgi:hypothetical protein
MGLRSQNRRRVSDAALRTQIRKSRALDSFRFRYDGIAAVCARVRNDLQRRIERSPPRLDLQKAPPALPEANNSVADAVTKNMRDRGVALGNPANPGFSSQTPACTPPERPKPRDIAPDPARGGGSNVWIPTLSMMPRSLGRGG